MDLDGVVMAQCTKLVLIAENAILLILVILVFIDIKHPYDPVMKYKYYTNINEMIRVRYDIKGTYFIPSINISFCAISKSNNRT